MTEFDNTLLQAFDVFGSWFLAVCCKISAAGLSSEIVLSGVYDLEMAVWHPATPSSGLLKCSVAGTSWYLCTQYSERMSRDEGLHTRNCARPRGLGRPSQEWLLSRDFVQARWTKLAHAAHWPGHAAVTLSSERCGARFQNLNCTQNGI